MLVAPFAVFLTETNRDWVEPDIMVVCNKDKIHDDGIHGAPDLVVEITSPSTKKKDSGVKLFKYRTEGMREYWIVDPHKRMLIIYNFMEEDWMPVMMPLKGEAPVAIYDGKLKISLDEIAASIDEFGE